MKMTSSIYWELYNKNIWMYRPCGAGKVELLKPVDDFDKDRNDVTILVWETLLEWNTVL